LTEYEYKVQVQNSSIGTVKNNISAMEKQNFDFNTKREEILKQLRAEKEGIEGKLANYPKVFDALDRLQEIDDSEAPKIAELESELEVVAGKEQDLKTQSRTLISNEKNKIICPNCEHEIKDDLPYTAEELKTSLKQLSVERDEIQKRLDVLYDAKQERFTKLSNRRRLENNRKDSERQLSEINERITDTEGWKAVEIDYSELKELENEFEAIKNKLITIKQDTTDLVDLEDMVSDKNLKGVILDQQLPFLNKYINEFLELFDSKFNFVIDSSFQEKIISRNSDNDFNSLSNGQKQRISLSILFAFLKLIEEKNGISTNLLILDEYLDSSLDIDGIDEVMSILDEVFSDKKDVVLISHNPDIKNRLELLNRIIKVDTIDGFSEFKEIENA
jgi:DNA repair exonuclease SbcCD ATPase subunit